MAITQRTYTLSAGWNSDDLMSTLQTALSDVSYHSAAQTGTILTFTNTAGTSIASAKGNRYLVSQSATSGSGVYAVFDILRNAATGAISTVTLVRGGKNYAQNDTITIPGASIGGTTPTDNITITVSTVSGSQGTTSTWYDVDSSSPATWGVCCVNNDETKRMGQTYYSFYTPANPTTNPILYIKSGPSFQSNTNVFNGVANLDYVNATPNNTTSPIYSQVIANTNQVQLTLNTYQSTLDTNFVVFQFSHQSGYGIVYREPFFLSKYNTATQPWDLNDYFLGGVYGIGRAISNTAECQIFNYVTAQSLPRRAAEWGYSGYQVSGARTINGIYETVFGRRNHNATLTVNTSTPTIYQRTINDLVHTNSSDYNPVITGLPINNTFVPVPYYIPNDFGITEIVGTNTTSVGNLISIGATTKWRVLQYANNTNAYTYNSSMAFVCKTVD